MRAALLHGPDDLRIEEIPDPAPGPGDVVIAIEGALTCGTDIKMLHRGHPALTAYPARFGHEFAGRIAATGTDVTGWRPGDRVVASDSAPCGACFFCLHGQEQLCEDLLYVFGGFAQYLLLPARLVACNLHRLPDDLPFAEAALCEPLASAIHAVDRADLQSGEFAAIVGGGALGLMLALVASSRGASVLLCDPHPGRLALARELGVAHTLPVTSDLDQPAAVRDLSAGGRGADVAFEAVGRPAVWEQTVAMTRKGGRAILFGGCALGTTITLPTDRIHYEEVDVLGVYHHSPSYIAAALRLIASRTLPFSRLIGDHRPLDGLREALADMERHGDRYLKIAIHPN